MQKIYKAIFTHFNYSSRRKSLIIFTFLTFELFLLVLIFLLSLKITSILKEDYSRHKYITSINKNTLSFDSTISALKYFYEPVPNSIETWNPDWLGYEVKNTINEDSLNESKTFQINKPTKTYRIIALGDSYTYGLYVPTNSTYPKILEKQLNEQLHCPDIKEFEVLNLGVTAYDVAYTVERFLKRGIKYSPDLVIWLIHNWNLGRIRDYNIPLQKELEKQGIPVFNSITKEHIADIADKKIEEQYGEKYVIDFQQYAFERLFDKYPSTIIFFTYSSISLKNKQFLSDQTLKYKNVSFYSDLTNTGSIEQYHVPDGHPSKTGHVVIASEIFKHIKNSLFSTCIKKN